MQDIIHLLPDSVANQIAAGEVVQRPSSVIKELVENSIDAGAKHIQIIIKDAGRTLIQVIDDGKGMSESDARLAFERHATSKIKSATDLFSLSTMGFRGEALASIAAVAQVELRTRQSDSELGTLIEIAGGKVERQEPISCSAGSNFAVKNLFFNIPARRKFLKSNTTEFRKIEEDFLRIALVYPDVSFELWHNDSECYHLNSSSLRERVINVFGKGINQNLLKIDVETSVVKLYGFVGKPETAKKRNDKQYFFVNGRFMKHPYFHRAVVQAYDRMLHPDTSPDYFIYLEVDPNTIDVNIHPTKTEIKFENEMAIWPIILASVKEALGRFNIMPSIDFDQEGSVSFQPMTMETRNNVKPPTISVDVNYNPFKTDEKASYSSSHSSKKTNWTDLYNDFESGRGTPVSDGCFDLPSKISMENYGLSDGYEANLPSSSSAGNDFESAGLKFEGEENASEYFQFRNRYVLTPVRSGLMCIDQHRAHVRILYDAYLNNLRQKRSVSHKLLFPEILELMPSESMILADIKEDLQYFGFDICSFGPNSYSVNGVPSETDNVDVKEFIMKMIDAAKEGIGKAKEQVLEAMALSLAQSVSLKAGKKLHSKEMAELVNSLFASPEHTATPDGKPIISILTDDDFEKMFK